MALVCVSLSRLTGSSLTHHLQWQVFFLTASVAMTLNIRARGNINSSAMFHQQIVVHVGINASYPYGTNVGS